MIDKDLIAYMFSGLSVMIMLLFYKRLNTIQIYLPLIIIYSVIIYLVKLFDVVKIKDFAPLITFIIIYHPIRYMIKLFIKREPIIYMRGVIITDDEKEKLNIFDYMFAPIVLGMTLFFSVFYFWDKL